MAAFQYGNKFSTHLAVLENHTEPQTSDRNWESKEKHLFFYFQVIKQHTKFCGLVGFGSMSVQSLSCGSWNCQNAIPHGLDFTPAFSSKERFIAYVVSMAPKQQERFTYAYIHKMILKTQKRGWFVVGFTSTLKDPLLHHLLKLGMFRNYWYDPYQSDKYCSPTLRVVSVDVWFNPTTSQCIWWIDSFNTRCMPDACV